MAERQSDALKHEQSQEKCHVVTCARFVDLSLGDIDSYLHEAATDYAPPDAVVKQAKSDNRCLEKSLGHVAAILVSLAWYEGSQRTK